MGRWRLSKAPIAPSRNFISANAISFLGGFRRKHPHVAFILLQPLTPAHAISLSQVHHPYPLGLVNYRRKRFGDIFYVFMYRIRDLIYANDIGCYTNRAQSSTNADILCMRSMVM